MKTNNYEQFKKIRKAVPPGSKAFKDKNKYTRKRKHKLKVEEE